MVIIEFTESCLVQKNYVFTTGSVKYVVSKGVYMRPEMARKFLFTLLFIVGENFCLHYFLLLAK